MATMYPGGPDTYATRYPVEYATFPQFMRDTLAATDPPPSPLAMSLITAGLMAVPVIGLMAAASLGEYQSYYATAYNANPPGTYTDVPLVPDPPVGWTPTTEPDNSDSAMLRMLYTNLISTYNEAHAAHLAADLILDRLPGGTTPPVVASNTDTARIMSMVLQVARQIAQLEQPRNALILGALLALSNQQAVQPPNTSALEAKIDNIDSDLGSVASALAAVAGDVAALPTDPPYNPTWPGLAFVTLGAAVPWSGPTRVDATCDGCLVHITSMPSGTGKYTVGGTDNWQHAGWLAFLADSTYGDEVQWLSLTDAVYVPRRLEGATGVLLFPRVGSSGTLTPWTRNP